MFSYYNEKSKNYNMLPNLIWGRSAKDAHYRHWSIKFNNLNAIQRLCLHSSLDQTPWHANGKNPFEHVCHVLQKQ